MLDETQKGAASEGSCDSKLTRKEFLGSIIRRAALAGALVAAPKIIDTFLIPPAEARTSTIHLNDTSNQRDTNHFHDQGPHTNPHRDGGGSHTNIHHDAHDQTGPRRDVDNTSEDDFG